MSALPKLAVALALVVGLGALPCHALAGTFAVPRLTGPIVDEAGFLSAGAEQQLAAALMKLKAQGGGTEVAVLTVEDLGGQSIEQASIQVVDQWKLGSAGQDNGVLLMVAKAERSIRIEVGQGLEGNLPDAYAKRIVDETMVPLFRSGNPEQAILLGVYQVAQRTNPDLDLAPIFGAESGHWKQRPRGAKGGWGALLPLLFIVAFVLMGRGRGRGGRLGGVGTGLLLGSMLGGGRGGRGGFRSGGGSFGGGGGGFSGGGASGGW